MNYTFLLFLVLLLFRLVCSNGVNQCQAPINSLNLAGLQGEVRYNGTYRHENCTWNLPHVNASKHVLLIYLEDLQMMYYDGPTSGCSGKLILPETTPFCKMPTTPCFVYSTPGSICTFTDVSKMAKNISSTCSSLMWLSVNLLPSAIRVEASAPDYKEFTFRYKFTTCVDYLEGRNSLTSGTPTFIAKLTPTSDKGNRTENAAQSQYETALIAVCVLLVVVLMLLVMVSYCALKKYVRARNQSEKPRAASPEFTAGTRVTSNQYDSRAEEPAFDENIAINTYEEIPTHRFSSNSREVVQNAIY